MKSIIAVITGIVVLSLLGGGIYFYRQTPQVSNGVIIPQAPVANIPELAPLDSVVAVPMSTSTTGGRVPASLGAATSSSVRKIVTTTMGGGGGSTTMTFISAVDETSTSSGAPASSTLVKGSDYIDAYTTLTLRYNAIGSAVQAVQKTMADVSSQYQASGLSSSVTDLLRVGAAQNASLHEANVEFRLALDTFDSLNRSISNIAIKERAQPIVAAGRSFEAAIGSYERAIDTLLAYRGVGDLASMSGALQSASRSVGETGAAFVKEVLAFKTYLSQWQK